MRTNRSTWWDLTWIWLIGRLCFDSSTSDLVADTTPSPVGGQSTTAHSVNEVTSQGLTFTVATSEADLEKGDHFHSLPTDLDSGFAEVGRLRGEELRGHSEFLLDGPPRPLRATLEFKLLAAAGRFDGINRFPFDGTMALEAYHPSRSPGATLSAFDEDTVTTLRTWSTSDFQPQVAIRLNLSDIVTESLNGGHAVLGLRLRCDPLPASHSGAMTFHAFTLLLENLVEFRDSNLERAIRSALSIPDGEITAGQLANLSSLVAPELGIAQLGGLEHALSLRSLDLSHNLIADLSPLQRLIHLEHLSLQGNLITELSPLIDFLALRDTSVEGLRLDNNLLDIAPGSTQRLIIETLQQLPTLTVRFRPQNLIDSDSDGLDDRFEEIIITTDPNDSARTLADVLPNDDFDGDGHTNREEFRRFSDPTDPARFGRAGDLDGDERVTILDLIRLQSHWQGRPISPDQEPFADTNLDDLINATDQDAILDAILAR